LNGTSSTEIHRVGMVLCRDISEMSNHHMGASKIKEVACSCHMQRVFLAGSSKKTLQQWMQRY